LVSLSEKKIDILKVKYCGEYLDLAETDIREVGKLHN